MPDREKYIEVLSKTAKTVKEFNEDIPIKISLECVEDILELLKEQEPLEPYACEGDMKCGNGCEIVGYIRESDGKIERLANYCPYCGRPVKWD